MRINATCKVPCKVLAGTPHPVSLRPVLALLLLGWCGAGCGDDASGGGDGGAGDGGTGMDAGRRQSPCGSVDDPEGNDDPGSATPVGFGPAFTACVDSKTDVDVYALTAPDSASGGYVKITVGGVGFGQVVGRLLTKDGTELASAPSPQKEYGFDLFYAAAPGKTVFLEIKDWGDHRDAFPYHLTATHYTIDDPLEPNDTRETAAMITVGDTTDAFMFVGHGDSGKIAKPAYDDWYAFMAAAGTLNVRVQGLPADVDMDAVAFDAGGAEIGMQHSNMLGGNVTFSIEVPEAGMVTLQMGLFTAEPVTAGAGTKLPLHFSEGYRLTLTQ